MPNVREHKIGIIMNGVTGRMGTNQHLMRSIVEIIKQGGVAISDEEAINLFSAGKNEALGIFDTIEEANDFAAKRSKAGGRAVDDPAFRRK